MILSQEDKSWGCHSVGMYVVLSTTIYMLNILDAQYLLIIPIILQTIKTLLPLVYK